MVEAPPIDTEPVIYDLNIQIVLGEQKLFGLAKLNSDKAKGQLGDSTNWDAGKPSTMDKTKPSRQSPRPLCQSRQAPLQRKQIPRGVLLCADAVESFSHCEEDDMVNGFGKSHPCVSFSWQLASRIDLL